jgi:hypothetical protein
MQVLGLQDTNTNSYENALNISQNMTLNPQE